MRRATSVALVVMAVGVLLIFFFLAPVTTYRGTFSEGAVIGIPFTAQVSASYVLLGCGEMYNPTYNFVTYSNASEPHYLYIGGAWQCGGNPG